MSGHRSAARTALDAARRGAHHGAFLAAVVAASLVAPAACTAAKPLPGPPAAGLSTEEKRKELVTQLRSDIAKTERVVALTELQIAKSRGAPYLTELQFRLAELYVEKSRYAYLLQQAEGSAGAGDKAGSQVAPEVRLTKQKALQVYGRILREDPDWPGCDRVRFYMAHEHRELGEFDSMLAMEEELVAKSPQSPLAPEALLIVGDHWFAAKELGKAEEAYQRVLAMQPSAARDLAAFKMGWVRFNQARHPDAVRFFEQAAASPLLDTASAETLTVKREALFDLVFSYTEARPSKGAADYFEKLAQSHPVYTGVLEKLANRYFIKQDWEAAVPAARRLVALSRDPARDVEFAGRLHDAVKAGGEKTPPRPEDVQAIVRVAARVHADERLGAAERAAQLQDLELWARDLATSLLVAARKGGDKPDRTASSAAADALAAWLSLFREHAQRPAMEKNQAEALFAAERWHEAGRAFERVTAALDRAETGAATGTPASLGEEALYNALAAHAKAAREQRGLSRWQKTDSLRAVAQLGARYVTRFPASPRVVQVKFNVARAAYDEADWKRAAELFSAFVGEHPDTPEAIAAASLALDALHSTGDYDELEKVGRVLAGNERLPGATKKELLETVARARGEQLSIVALQSTARTGDAGAGLVELAEKAGRSPLGEKALHAAFATYREKRDAAKVADLGAKFLATYPTSTLLVDVLRSQASLASDLSDFDAAVTAWELLGERFATEPTGLEALRNAATLRLLLGDPKRAVASLERIPVERRTGAVGLQLAEARLQAGDLPGAEAQALLLTKADPSDPDAAGLLCRVLLLAGKPLEAQRTAAAAIKAVKKARATGESMARLWDLSGEASLRLLQAAPADPLDAQVALLRGVQEASLAVAQLRAAELAVAGVYRLAAAFEKLAQTLAATPPPPKLSAADQQRFAETVAQQAAGLRAQAQSAFDSCGKKARELELFSPIVAACEKGQPQPGLSGPQPAGPPSPTAPASGAEIGKAREALAARPGPTGLEQLGLRQLAAGDLRRARLTFQRALQLDELRPGLHAALGVALARLGEPAAARDSYRRALELDPTLDRAHAGLAALRCRFGDDQGAKAQLARMRSKPDARADDADPELARCVP